MQKIKVKISATGEVEYEVSGVKGKQCKALTKPIDDMSNVLETKVTGEFCEAPLPERVTSKGE